MVGRCGAPGAHSRAIMSPATTRQGPPGGPGGLGGRVAPLVLSDKPSALVEVPLFPGALSSGALLARASVEAPARSDSCVGDRSGQFLWWRGGGRRGLCRCRRFRGGSWRASLMGWEIGGGSGRSGGAPWFRVWISSAAARWGPGVCAAARCLCCWLEALKFCRGSLGDSSPCLAVRRGGAADLCPLENPRQVEEASWPRGAPAASLVPRLLPSDPGPRGGFRPSLGQPSPSQTFLPLSDTLPPFPDIPPSVRQPFLSHTFFSLPDIRPFLRQPSLSHTFFSLSDILPSLRHSHFPEQSSLSQTF